MGGGVLSPSPTSLLNPSPLPRRRPMARFPFSSRPSIGPANCCHHLASVQVPAVKAFNLIIIPGAKRAAPPASVCPSKILWPIQWGQSGGRELGWWWWWGGYRISLPSLSKRLNVRIIGTETGSRDLCLSIHPSVRPYASHLRAPSLTVASRHPFPLEGNQTEPKKSWYFYQTPPLSFPATPPSSPSSQKPVESKSSTVETPQRLNLTKGGNSRLNRPPSSSSSSPQCLGRRR